MLREGRRKEREGRREGGGVSFFTLNVNNRYDRLF